MREGNELSIFSRYQMISVRIINIYSPQLLPERRASAQKVFEVFCCALMFAENNIRYWKTYAKIGQQKKFQVH